jgi:diguanylate cyclase (GGDEF)-like protein
MEAADRGAANPDTVDRPLSVVRDSADSRDREDGDVRLSAGELSTQQRLQAADRRDATAHARDLAALARDEAARAREAEMDERDAAFEQAESNRTKTGAELVLRAAEHRRRAAEHRALAAEQRAAAADDRLHAAESRERAAGDRELALADRHALATQLAIAETDALTGARTRSAGMRDLEHELDRCRRTGGPLAVAYVDVVGLKTLNDTSGHKAGDTLLKAVVVLLKQHLRSYDLVIRVGGDEFVCVASNMPMTDLRRRFDAISVTLAAEPTNAAIRTGFAALAPGEAAGELIARADNEIVGSRRT